MVTIQTLSKYNPEFYDKFGYQKDEWVDVSDIGKSFDGVILTREEFLKVENAYLSCLEYIMDQYNIERLQVLKDSLEIEEFCHYQEWLFDVADEDVINYKDKSWLGRSDIRRFLRLMMRTLTGYAITNQKGFFIWGSGDMHFDIGLPDSLEINPEEIRKRGLYLKYVAAYSPDSPELEDYNEVLTKYIE